MRVRARRSLACLLALLLPLPLASAQPAAAPGLAGGWSGSATLTNEWPGLSCRYQSGPEEEAVRLELSGEAGRLRGSLAIDIAPAEGSTCPPLRKRYAIAEVTEAPGTVAFTDSGGNEWTLAVRRQGEVLQGLLAWRTGGPDQPLADGYTGPDGQRPLSRLSGEVRLHRAATPGAAVAANSGSGDAPSGTAASTPRAGAGTHAKHVAAVVGANLVGLGLLYGVNRVGQGSGTDGTTVCSPRVCQVGPPGQGCVCEPTATTGASCGSTEAGADIGEVCDGRDAPCRAGLSCDLLPDSTEYMCFEPETNCPGQ